MDTPRAPRRDAARNRARLLAAARDVFADQGHDAALEEIARAAEVSRTTLYRNFGTREQLAAEVALDGIEQIESRAAELLDDPVGLPRLFDFVLGLQLANRALAPVLAHDHDQFSELARRTAATFERLLPPGGRGGPLRPGAGLVDLLLALQMSEAVAADPDPGRRPARHERGRRILLGGLFEPGVVQAVLAGDA